MLSNRSLPRVTVIPELPYADVREAAEWLCRVFGFTTRLMIGNHRAQLNVGDGAVVLIEEGEDRSRCSVMVRVEDADAHQQRVVREGAGVLGPPATHPYGERQYTATDLAGHYWTFSQSVADVHPSEWGGEAGAL